jgi:hypothetical protein
MGYENKLRYNSEAIEFISLLKDFEYEKFESWVESLVLQIGSNNILQYIEEKKRWNNAAIQKSNKLCRADFSQQSKNLIAALADFDAEDCIRWFSNALTMGKNDITNYIEYKKAELKN